jgi:hypothetical protein
MANKEDDDNVDLGKLDDVFETSDNDQEDDDQGSEQEAATTETSSIASLEDKGEPNAATPAAEKEQTANEAPEKGQVPIAALHDERRKRQELERELEKLRNPEQKKQEEVPDVFVDPNAFTQHLKEHTTKEIAKHRRELSQDLLREAKPDYDEKVSKFVEAVKTRPDLIDQMNASLNPARFAYDFGKAELDREAKLKLVDEIGDPVAYKERMKQEIIAELGLTIPASKKPKFENTPSLATAPSVRADSVKSINDVNDLFEDDD